MSKNSISQSLPPENVTLPHSPSNPHIASSAQRDLVEAARPTERDSLSPFLDIDWLCDLHGQTECSRSDAMRSDAVCSRFRSQ